MTLNVVLNLESKPTLAQSVARQEQTHSEFFFDSYSDFTTSNEQIAKQMPAQSYVASTTCTGDFCCNQQYSVTAITTAAGAIAERYAYTAYGLPTILNASATIIASSAISNRYTYTGREWDATLGLHHFRARWVSPIAGRFLGRDPLGFDSGDTNHYSFLSGIALSGIDPNGMQTQLPYKRPHYIPPSVSPHPRRGRVTIDFEKTKTERCIFYADPFPGIAGIDDIPLNGGKRIPFTSMDDVIGEILKEGCCEIIFAGHQGRGNHGGIEGMIDCNPYDPSNSRRIKWALGIVGCDGCSLILAGCGGVTSNHENCRQSLAKDTGCDVFGSSEGIMIPEPTDMPAKFYCTLDSKSVGEKCPFGGNYELWPFKRYSPD